MFRFNNNTPISFDDALPEAVDVVVIGAGVIGVCTALQLTQRGLKVLVCDKGRVAGEQSSRNWGWVRSTGRDEYEVPIAMDSTKIWESMQRELGDGIGFSRQGCLALAKSDKELAEYAAWIPIAEKYGLDTRMIGAEEANTLAKTSEGFWRGGMYTPSDGRAEPFTAVPTIARSLQSKGGFIRENCAVRGIETQAGSPCSVVTEHGRVATESVLVAAGGWSSLFLSNLGIRLPQLVVKGTVARTAPTEEFFSGAGVFEDICIRRRRDGGYTVASGFCEHYIGANSFRFLFDFIPSMGSASDMTVRLGQDLTQRPWVGGSWNNTDVTIFESTRVSNPAPSAKALRKMRALLKKHVPQLAEISFEESWAGMIDATPDVVPVMDEIPSRPGVFLATGFSGHGFGIGPGAGKVMADLVTGQNPVYDLSRFRFSRFSDGSKMRPGPAI